MKNILLVFIDGLQFDEAVNRMKILKNTENSRVIPGIGFSNNIYPEMLCGVNPDEIGYFNEWSPVKKINPELPFYLRWLDVFRWNLYINAGIRKIILRKIFKLDFSNVPFKYAHYFKPQGSHNFRDLTGNNILHDYNFEIYDSVETGLGVGIKDNFIIDKLNNELESKNYLLSLCDIDNIAHVYGTTSDKFDNHLNNLDDRLKKLFDRFTDQNSENEIYLFSDHGMVDVSSVVNFNIEKKFGSMDKDKYLYFIDSTYMRVWVKDKSLMGEFEKYLSSREFGELLTEGQRKDFGLVNREFGDFIFRGKEGVMFVPNFYGGRANKAMHGYDSHLRSQNAFFSKVDTNSNEFEMPRTSKEVFHYLTKVCNAK
jgi:predicted AlkP superfamily pyrophosphatase or phosphodiesterase